MLPFLLKA